ncbi:hypothetical protein [Noviherbaspirillum denitrificans]|uniref:Uncharacterized protein n=1 Tax=Noviherbaspirillum denitrificans TaxID=1968433 RepID=A0A254T759_9BURK|nr:hypothetical protein [Noviherbaspirillum denitrificans]OWW18405.1 hypothetical protein AYR66_00975 [Noviherbaspirillum denitrificans]OWW19369.1 hypothetical protein AYR66_07460 [Noviherbaspirillum denitrificans]
MPITSLPTPPSTSNPSTFAALADGLLAALPTFVTEANALAAAITAMVAGGAMTIPYTFDSTTSDADPGAGKLRLSSATQNTSTVIRLDVAGSDGSTWTSVIDTWDDSTSTIKGFIRLVKATDATKWLIFSVSSIASPAGYKNITVAPVASSAANPFVNGDPLVAYFTAKGDKGDSAQNGLSSPLAVLTPTAAANVDALNVFTAAYDNYLILGQGILPAASDSLQLRFAVAGAADAGSNYYNQSGEAGGAISAATTGVVLTSGASVVSTGKGCSFALQILNANDAASLKVLGGKVIWQNAGTPTFVLNGAHTAYPAANVISGVRFFWGSGNNFAATGKIRIYGYNNT